MKTRLVLVLNIVEGTRVCNVNINKLIKILIEIPLLILLELSLEAAVVTSDA